MNGFDEMEDDLQAKQETLVEERLASQEEGLIDEGKTQVVAFQLHDQLFGVNIRDITEVKQLPDITDVFHTPNFVVGVVNIRGDICAVLDIGLFFDLTRTDLSDSKKLVILQSDGKEAGIIADSMSGVQWIEEDNIQSPPPTVAGVSSEWIDGIVQKQDDPLILLDIPSIFRSDRIEEL
jgi:purine-binding chemotaxis protein CheW